jgi:hypothetical protein
MTNNLRNHIICLALVIPSAFIALGIVTMSGLLPKAYFWWSAIIWVPALIFSALILIGLRMKPGPYDD